jgi:predicted nucleotidyltransferase
MLNLPLAVENNMTLDQFIERLRGRAEIDGLIVMGSAAAGAPGPHSDYDLLLVFETLPAPLSVGLTWIDGRLTDLIFVTTAELDRLVSGGPQAVPADGQTGRLIAWLRGGRIALDRAGRLAAARAALQADGWTRGPAWGEQYRAWFGLNYDLAQTRRLAASPDPAAQAVVDVRLLFGLSSVWFAYFQLRGLPQFGKAAVKHLARHDPEFLALFQRCADEPDRLLRLALNGKLVERAAAPLGGLWVEGATALQFQEGAEIEPATVQAALAWWSNLVNTI